MKVPREPILMHSLRQRAIVSLPQPPPPPPPPPPNLMLLPPPLDPPHRVFQVLLPSHFQMTVMCMQLLDILHMHALCSSLIIMNTLAAILGLGFQRSAAAFLLLAHQACGMAVQ